LNQAANIFWNDTWQISEDQWSSDVFIQASPTPVFNFNLK
jgi:hypothetical protein